MYGVCFSHIVGVSICITHDAVYPDPQASNESIVAKTLMNDWNPFQICNEHDFNYESVFWMPTASYMLWAMGFFHFNRSAQLSWDQMWFDQWKKTQHLLKTLNLSLSILKSVDKINWFLIIINRNISNHLIIDDIVIVAFKSIPILLHTFNISIALCHTSSSTEKLFMDITRVATYIEEARV